MMQDKKKCPVCGALVEADFSFCTECGHRFEEPVISTTTTVNTNHTGGVVQDEPTVKQYGNAAGGDMITNTHVTNNYSVHEKTELEKLEEKKRAYYRLCQEYYRDGLITDENERRLENHRLSIDLDKTIAEELRETAKDLSKRKSNTLSPVQRVTVQKTATILDMNDPQLIANQLKQLAALQEHYVDDALSCAYFQLKAIITYAAYVSDYEQTDAHDYWEVFWGYIAYKLNGDNGAANRLMAELGEWDNRYPSSNQQILALTGAMMDNEAVNISFYAQGLAIHTLSPVLQHFANAVEKVCHNDWLNTPTVLPSCAFFVGALFGSYTKDCQKRADLQRQETMAQIAKRQEEENRRKVAEANARFEEEQRLKAEAEVQKAAEERKQCEAEAYKATEERKQREAEAWQAAEERKQREADAQKAAEERKQKEAEVKKQKAILRQKRAERAKIVIPIVVGVIGLVMFFFFCILGMVMCHTVNIETENMREIHAEEIITEAKNDYYALAEQCTNSIQENSLKNEKNIANLDKVVNDIQRLREMEQTPELAGYNQSQALTQSLKNALEQLEYECDEVIATWANIDESEVNSAKRMKKQIDKIKKRL